MKKMFENVLAGMLAAGLLFSIISCASSEGLSQEEFNEDFAEVYSEYEASLILDGAQAYTVKTGDTLSSIAKTFYGEERGYYFPIIMLASSDVILDPDLITPGMNLIVPDLDRNLANPETRKQMKFFFKDIADIYEEKTTTNAPKTRRELLKITEEL